MLNRVSQPAIATMRADEEIKGFASHPAFHTHIGQAFPPKRSARLGLAQVVHLRRVVTDRSAEPVALGIRVDISKRAWINQQRLPVDSQLHTQRIGMVVACPACSVRAGINHELTCHGIRTGHHVDSAVLQIKGSRRWLLERKFLEPPRPRGSKQPNCFLPNGTSHCFKVGPVEQHRSGCKGIEQLPRTVTPRVKYSPTVIISKLGKRPRSTQGAEDVKHLFHGPVQHSGDCHSV